MKIWLRAPGNEDPQPVPTVIAVALVLGPLGIGTINRFGKLHIEADGFRGLYNCIAVYWAQVSGIPERGLTDEEIIIINRELDRYFHVGEFAEGTCKHAF